MPLQSTPLVAVALGKVFALGVALVLAFVFVVVRTWVAVFILLLVCGLNLIRTGVPARCTALVGSALLGQSWGRKQREGNYRQAQVSHRLHVSFLEACAGKKLDTPIPPEMGQALFQRIIPCISADYVQKGGGRNAGYASKRDRIVQNLPKRQSTHDLPEDSRISSEPIIGWRR
jgi:hypothetical protein